MPCGLFKNQIQNETRKQPISFVCFIFLCLTNVGNLLIPKMN
jgi:hypothetical protein